MVTICLPGRDHQPAERGMKGRPVTTTSTVEYAPGALMAMNRTAARQDAGLERAGETAGSHGRQDHVGRCQGSVMPYVRYDHGGEHRDVACAWF